MAESSSMFAPLPSPWMMEEAPLTPKIHNKRRSSLTTASGNTTENSSFDCQSLQRSLKRVRLTSTLSPGELRLGRDLRHAVLNHRWIPITDDEWKIMFPMMSEQRVIRPSINISNEDEFTQEALRQQQQQQHEGDPSNNVSGTVTRDEQDPMEFTLRIGVTATLHLQFPRMYPHRPPVVRRIDYHHQPAAASSSSNNHHHASRRWMAGNLTHSNWSSSDRDDYCQSSAVAHQKKLKRIVIAESPDCVKDVVSTPDTIVLTEWSPVSRLADIIDWLIKAVILQPEQSSSTPTASNNYCSSMEGFEQGVHDGDEEGWDEKKDDDDDYGSHWGPKNLPYDSSDRATEKNPSVFSPSYQSRSVAAGESSKPSFRHQRFQKIHRLEVPPKSSFFPPNRFDVGYERPEKRLNEQQDSMDFQFID